MKYDDKILIKWATLTTAFHFLHFIMLLLDIQAST